MPKLALRRVLPYTKVQLFDLVAHIQAYPKFVPWCEEVVIREQKDNILLADLTVGFKAIKGTYTSHVYLDIGGSTIRVELAEGPFKHLYQKWYFQVLGTDGCEVHFDIDFELKSAFLNRILMLYLDRACEKMLIAFEERAQFLYGKQP